MNRAPHPILAALLRGGGAAARLNAALAQAEMRVATLHVDLDGDPLCKPAGWEALVSVTAPEARLAGLLARLAEERGTAEEPRSGWPISSSAPEPTAETRPPRPAPPDREAARDAGDGAPGSTGPRQRLAVEDGSMPRRAADPRGAADAAAVPGNRRTRGDRATRAVAPAGLPVGDDPLLRAAAARSVRAAADAAIARLVADLLAGDHGASAEPAAAAPPADGPVEQRIADVLDRIAGRAATARPFAGTTPAAGRPASAPPAADPAPATGPAEAAPPRNGLARLLARGRRENLIAGDDSGPRDVASSVPDRATGQGPRIAPASDLASHLGRRPVRPQVPDERVAEDPEAFARSLTDLLRREARSAGIDLKGGR